MVVRSLRRIGSRLLLASVVTVAAAVAGSTLALEGAQAKPRSSHFLVSVVFTGDGYVRALNGAQSNLTAVAWWEDDIISAESSSYSVVLDQSAETTRLEGYGATNATGVGGSCTAAYELLQQLHPSSGTSSGARFYTSQDHANLADPGKAGVLVSALPYWKDYVRTSPPAPPSCLSTSAALMPDLAAQWGSNPAQCALEPNKKTCAQTLRLRKAIPSSGGTSEEVAGTAQITASRIDDLSITLPDPPIAEVLQDMVRLWIPPNIKLIQTNSYPPGIVRLPPILIPKTDEGEIDGQVYIAKQPIVTTKAKMTNASAVALPLAWSRAGLAAVRRIAQPTQLTVTVTFNPTHGTPMTESENVYVLPTLRAGRTAHPQTPKPSISSVDFRGSAANPTIIVHGNNLGTLPHPSPTGHPAGQNGCPSTANETGYDYGTNLYIALPAKNWSGGRYRPNLGETDCIDLVVTKFTPTEVDFHLGPFYTSLYPKFSLAAGSQADLGVNGATFTTTVKYG